MRKLVVLVALTTIASCKTNDGIGPTSVDKVSVSTGASQIVVNGTAQATALVEDENGNPLTGKTIEWSSLNNAIATVSSAGVVRGVSPGTATIQGRVEGVVGRATIQVVAPSVACTAGPTTINSGVGGVTVLSALAASGCIKLPQLSGPSEFIVIAANSNSIPDDLATYVIKADDGEVVPNTALLATPARIAASLIVPEPPSPQLQFERGLRATERAQLAIPDAQRAFSRRGPENQLRYSTGVIVPAVGDKREFKVPVTSEGKSGGCSDFTRVNATVRVVSGKAVIYTDDASPAGGFSILDLTQIAAEFDNIIYPTDVAYFGTPLDLDDNGARVIILYTPQVNRLTPAGLSGTFVGGFFFVGDLFPITGDGACAQSNVGEIFYALTPDVNGTINGNRRLVADVRQGTRGTMAHELEHMINASERIRSPIIQEFEDIWLDEALGHFAEDAVGRAVRGIGEAENADFARLSGFEFNAFFFQNFARFQRYLQNPGPNSPTSRFADSSLADRGAAWALLRYAADHYAPGGDVKAFTRALAGGPYIGVDNLLRRAGNVPFDTLISGWMVANYADDAGIPNLPAKYTYTSYNMRSNVSNITTSRTYPLLVNPIIGGSYVSGVLSARSASGNYFRVTRGNGALAKSIRFLNDDGRTTASFTGASYYVLRIQ
ncbi:MAG TPA: Ig-like domain-containing protein [Gemmatimonadaceae bacterium]|nr:Ig-like domain-containing protein [Gemmatimonadaceae bacterium]